MNKKESIIYIFPNSSSFIKSDIKMLSKYYNIIENTYNWKRKKLTPYYLLKQFFFLVKNTKKAKAIIISFGGYWSLLPCLLGKIFKTPTYIINNGTDVASIPSLNYGSLRKPIIKFFCKLSYKNATTLLPVSSSLIKTKNTYYSNDLSSLQGLKHFFPKLKTPIKVIPNGFDTSFWQQNKEIKKNKYDFVTVFSQDQYILKGGDLIVQVAKIFPHLNFFIVGCTSPNNNSMPKNVSFLGKVKPNELRNIFSQCSFYLQLSIYEGFGCALCEAMLCNCIPIGSNVNIIPDIIGNSGYIIKERNIKNLENLLQKVINPMNKNNFGEIARKRIITNYNINIREKELITLLNNSQQNHD